LKYQTYSSSHRFAREKGLHGCRRERQKREGEGVVTGGEKFQDMSKDGVVLGEKTQGKVRKTKIYFISICMRSVTVKGKTQKGFL